MLKELMYMLSSLASTLEGTGLTYTSGIPTYVFMRFIKVRKRERINEIETKIGRRQHLSRRKALFEILPFLSLDVKRGRGDVVKGLGLDSEDEKILAEVAL